MKKQRSVSNKLALGLLWFGESIFLVFIPLIVGHFVFGHDYEIPSKELIPFFSFQGWIAGFSVIFICVCLVMCGFYLYIGLNEWNKKQTK